MGVQGKQETDDGQMVKTVNAVKPSKTTTKKQGWKYHCPLFEGDVKTFFADCNWQKEVQRQVLWTTETKINLYQNDGKPMYGERRGLFMILNIQVHL